MARTTRRGCGGSSRCCIQLQSGLERRCKCRLARRGEFRKGRSLTKRLQAMIWMLTKICLPLPRCPNYYKTQKTWSDNPLQAKARSESYDRKSSTSNERKTYLASNPQPSPPSPSTRSSRSSSPPVPPQPSTSTISRLPHPRQRRTPCLLAYTSATRP